MFDFEFMFGLHVCESPLLLPECHGPNIQLHDPIESCSSWKENASYREKQHPRCLPIKTRQLLHITFEKVVETLQM